MPKMWADGRNYNCSAKPFNADLYMLITDDDIRKVRAEATKAGDDMMVEFCDAALGGDNQGRVVVGDAIIGHRREVLEPNDKKRMARFGGGGDNGR